ncbi:MAG: esterase-like activity of phytase family protein, partial [Rhodobacteraceae bacterium]|nr:esterase-like activity of phytase family protein [Paracoccaceae bacterium]
IALPERPNADGVFPIYLFPGTVWSRLRGIPAVGPYLAVSTDIGPDGQFYLLERAVGVTGFRTWIRRWG